MVRECCGGTRRKFPQECNTPASSFSSSCFFSLSLHLLLFSIPPFTLYRFILSPISLSSFSHSTPPLNPFFSPLCSDSPAISSPHAGKVEPLPERLITFLPPAVYTPVRGSHTDSLPPVEQSGT